MSRAACGHVLVRMIVESGAFAEGSVVRKVWCVRTIDVQFARRHT